MKRVTQSLSRFTKQEVDRIFKQARRVLKQAGLIILIAPQQGHHGKILVITPRVSGTAPQRNTIRRRLKALYLEEKLFERGYDCIVLVKAEAMKLTFDKLKELLLKAFESI